MTIKKWNNASGYAAQSDVLERALATPTHSLEELLSRMRGSGHGAIYLSGTRLDNDYCLGSTDIGMLLSILPEDGQKAAEPGYHPGSTEVYITFQGSLVMEYLDAGRVREATVGGNQVLALPPGQCHRVPYEPHRQAASLIVKTCLDAKPSVVRCDDCTYYRDKNECGLHQRWSADIEA